jgi:hypothetical protein
METASISTLSLGIHVLASSILIQACLLWYLWGGEVKPVFFSLKGFSALVMEINLRLLQFGATLKHFSQRQERMLSRQCQQGLLL